MTAPTSLQLAIAAGALMGLGVALLVWRGGERLFVPVPLG